MPTYRRDTARLRSVAGEFEGMKARLDATVGLEDRYGGCFGSSDVAEAFGEFVSGWSHKREALGRDLDGAATSLRDMAGKFDELETQLSQRHSGGGG
jgi:hypothetical protein